MRRLTAYLLCFAFLTVGAEADAQEPGASSSPRLRRTLNEGWLYREGGVDEALPAAAAIGDWTRVDLPHTWNAEDAFDKEEGYRRGVGLYRKDFVIEEALAGKRLFLHFEGVNQKASVYVNGQEAGRHVGGYTAFAFDITDLVRAGEPNRLLVAVDNRHDPDVPPLNADFTFYGGIYRDVWLLATAPLHFDVLDHASPGVYIDTPQASRERATVRVRSRIVEEDGAQAAARVLHRILDAHGREVSRFTSPVPLQSQTSVAEAEQVIENPHLWSPANPYLYTLETLLYDGDRLADRVRVPFGVRWIETSGSEGFLLNGRRLYLAGTNRHQDREGAGNALTDEQHRLDMRLIKENGFNFVRLAHYPQDAAVLDEADRLGLLVWEEIPVVNQISTSEAFRENSRLMLTEMIRQHYNHPSIAMWGYMNEVLLVEPRPKPEGYEEAVVALASELNTLAKAEDPHRPTTTALSHGEVDNGTGFQDVADILGMNLYFGWYYNDFLTLGPILDQVHARHPGKPLIVSEYGAGTDERIHSRAPEAFDFSTEWGQLFHETALPQLLSRDYLAGSAVWNQFDFGSSGRQDSKNAINQKGLYFFDRTPKDVAFYYRASLLDRPEIHIARDWSRTAGSKPFPLKVYANTDQVTLTLNGRPAGEQPVVNSNAVFHIQLQPGSNLIEARGTRSGEPAADISHVFLSDDAFAENDVSTGTIAVNAGGTYEVIGADGTVWQADQTYAPGARWGYEGGKGRLSHHRLYGTSVDPLFQAARDSASVYRFDVPAGAYEVEVGLVELDDRAPGERVFSVTANGSPLFSDIDLAATSGRYRVVTRRAKVFVSDDEGLQVRFAASAGTATVSSVRVRRE